MNVFEGISDAQAEAVVDGLALKRVERASAVEQVKRLYSLFSQSDCTLVEINPLAETAEGQLVAADAKLNFDDNAAFRQKDTFALRDHSQEDPREVCTSPLSPPHRPLLRLTVWKGLSRWRLQPAT